MTTWMQHHYIRNQRLDASKRRGVEAKRGNSIKSNDQEENLCGPAAAPVLEVEQEEGETKRDDAYGGRR